MLQLLPKEYMQKLELINVIVIKIEKKLIEKFVKEISLLLFFKKDELNHLKRIKSLDENLVKFIVCKEMVI